MAIMEARRNLFLQFTGDGHLWLGTEDCCANAMRQAAECQAIRRAAYLALRLSNGRYREW